jgi:chromosomal replication initiation ATPase DnaA
MIVVAYRRTMAGAKRIVDERPKKPTPKRDRLIEMTNLWIRARKLRSIQIEADLAEKRRVIAIKQSRVNIPIVPFTAPNILIEQVSFWSGIPVWEILGPSRAYPIVEARFDAIAAIAVNCRLAGRKMRQTDIGRHFGRDHATIIQALRQRGLHD